LRCDARKAYPDACARCKARNLECKFDPSFRRVPARGRLEEVSAKLNHLQQTLALNQAGSVHSSRARSIPSDFVQSAALDSTESKEERITLDDGGCFGLENFTGKNLNLDPERRQLGDIIIENQVIAELFMQYVLYFPMLFPFAYLLTKYSFYIFRHPHMPIVDTRVSIDKMCLSNPLLFWTIIVVSCCQNPQHGNLHPRLASPYQKLLSTALVNSINSLQAVQAILLLCVWPFPIRHERDDPSLNYCGLAISAAMQLGLHCPSYRNEYKISKTPESKTHSVVTWLACFQISTW